MPRTGALTPGWPQVPSLGVRDPWESPGRPSGSAGPYLYPLARHLLVALYYRLPVTQEALVAAGHRVGTVPDVGIRVP